MVRGEWLVGRRARTYGPMLRSLDIRDVLIIDRLSLELRSRA